MQSAAVLKTMIMLLHSNTTSKQISKLFIDNFTFEKEILSIANKSVSFIISEILPLNSYSQNETDMDIHLT